MCSEGQDSFEDLYSLFLHSLLGGQSVNQSAPKLAGRKVGSSCHGSKVAPPD